MLQRNNEETYDLNLKYFKLKNNIVLMLRIKLVVMQLKQHLGKKLLITCVYSFWGITKSQMTEQRQQVFKVSKLMK